MQCFGWPLPAFFRYNKKEAKEAWKKADPLWHTKCWKKRSVQKNSKTLKLYLSVILVPDSLLLKFLLPNFFLLVIEKKACLPCFCSKDRLRTYCPTKDGNARPNYLVSFHFCPIETDKVNILCYGTLNSINFQFKFICEIIPQAISHIFDEILVRVHGSICWILKGKKN